MTGVSPDELLEEELAFTDELDEELLDEYSEENSEKELCKEDCMPVRGITGKSQAEKDCTINKLANKTPIFFISAFLLMCSIMIIAQPQTKVK